MRDPVVDSSGQTIIEAWRKFAEQMEALADLAQRLEPGSPRACELAETFLPSLAPMAAMAEQMQGAALRAIHALQTAAAAQQGE